MDLFSLVNECSSSVVSTIVTVVHFYLKLEFTVTVPDSYIIGLYDKLILDCEGLQPSYKVGKVWNLSVFQVGKSVDIEHN